ncbi:MAG: FRG domain-containing protein [Sandaracinaceae bacterium]
MAHPEPPPPPPADADGVPTIVIQDWCDLQSVLFQDAWMPDIERYRSRMAFRGLSDARYGLETTLIRLGGPFTVLERHLLRNFKKYAHRRVTEGDSVWHWLSLAQHHGLPTRLLDWTYSPLVAAHFATANIERYDVDGAIWAVNYIDVHALLPPKLRSVLDLEGANVFTVEMLSETVRSLAELAGLAEQPIALFVEPPSLDDRIVHQHALFTVMSDPTARLNRWLVEQPSVSWRKIVIPADRKWEIRDKLDQSNLTERVLFPGLDGLSSWLRRHYSPKDPPDGLPW